MGAHQFKERPPSNGQTLPVERANLPNGTNLLGIIKSWKTTAPRTVVLLAAIFGWFLPLQKAHSGDTQYFKWYMALARGEDGKKEKPPEAIALHGTAVNWLLAQIFFTAIFLLLSWYIITTVKSDPRTKATGLRQTLRVVASLTS